MNIQGTWYNELGSTLFLEPISEAQFRGLYTTGVSATACAHGAFEIMGSTDTDSGGDTVGFTVVWKNNQSNCRSVTAWSRQAQTINE